MDSSIQSAGLLIVGWPVMVLAWPHSTLVIRQKHMVYKLKPSGCWILIGVLVGSVILGLYRINDCKMTEDEFFSVNIAQRSLVESWSVRKDPGFYSNNSPPLYATVLHFIWRISGESLFWSRLFSVIFNVIALYFIFLLSRLLFNKAVGLMAVSLAALNYSYILFSKMIRGYALFNLLTLASIYIFFKIVLDKWFGNRYKLLLAAINTAILYTFYFGAIVIFLELILSCFFLSGRLLRRTWLWLLSSFIIFLPWLPRFLNDYYVLDTVRFRISSIHNFLGVALIRFRQSIFHDQELLILYLAAVIFSLIYGFVLFGRKDKKRPLIISLAVIFLVGFLLINYLTAGIKDDSRARYSFPYIFPVFILTAVLVKQMRRYAGGRRVSARYLSIRRSLSADISGCPRSNFGRRSLPRLRSRQGISQSGIRRSHH